MKKIVCLLLLLILSAVLVFTSCDDGTPASGEATETGGKTGETTNPSGNPSKPENPSQPDQPAHTHE